MKPVNCPTCKKPVEAEGKAFPFCSERCRLVDLGNWIDGRYRIAATNDERTSDGDGEEGEDEG
ncbi:MAG: DNA gyrase inhibitor YacG [Polyangia bacterium]